jgi:heat shock transcription factor
VVDEDEFAKKLIPELFKHNNYASFVRQLNMYGFHKRVGLSDNSMRASERKGKSPNEYENKYFIRGHPNLLWLITKPKNNSKKKGAKNAEGEEDSDDEPAGGDNLTPGGFSAAQSASRALPPPPEVSGMPTGKDLLYLRDEFRKIREYQAQILQRMQSLEQTQTAIQKEQAAQQQANKRVDEIFKMYAQHEQVMKQMVRVIAFHYNKNNDDSTSQLLKDIMQAGMITGSHGSNQSGVFELGDDFGPIPGQSPGPLGAPRKARGLLEAPPSALAGNVRSAPAAVPVFVHGLGSSPEPVSVTELYGLETSPHELGKITEILDAPADTPPSTLNMPEHEELYNILGASTGTTAAGHGLGDLPSTTIPTNMAGAPAPNLSQHLHVPPAPAAAPASPPLADIHSTPVPSIPPHLSTQDEIETIKQMSDRVGTQLHNMSPYIAPLSPSGRIPSLDGLEPESYFAGIDHPDSFDINQWITDPPNNSHHQTDFDNLFNFNHHMDNTENAPSPSGTEEICKGDLLESPTQPTRGTKRRKVQH